MRLWKAILRALGLSDEARVRISAPGIDVELTGDPEKVRAVLSVVRQELEKPRMLTRGRRAERGRRRTLHPMSARDSQVVRPTELDEMDSPYALPEAVVMPVPDEDVTAERLVRRDPARSADRRSPEIDTVEVRAERDTSTPPGFGEVPSEETISGYDDDEPDAEATAIAPNPSGAVPVASRNRGFVTDGGPTIMPRHGSND